MSFDLLWVAVLVRGIAPTGKELNQGGKYRFAPVSHDGEILTLDDEVWNNVPKNLNAGAKSQHLDLHGYDGSFIRSAIANHRGNVLLGCLGEGLEKSVDGKPMADGLAVRVSAHTELFSPFVEIGYDVLDAGCLSGLANIGLIPGEASSVSAFRQCTNDHGLFGKRADAASYAKAISKLATEHAPFFPVRVLRKRAAGTV